MFTTNRNPSNEANSSRPNIGWLSNRRLSLRIKLPLIVILLLILAFLISTILSVRASQTALIETLKGELTAQTATKAELIRTNLVWTRSVAIDLAASAEVVDYDQDTILNLIHNTLVHNEQIFGSTIAYEPHKFQSDIYYWSPYYSRSPNGELRFTQLGNPEYNYFGWEWYTLPKASGKPVLSPPYYDEGGGEIWMVTWSAPFFDNAGEFKGVATADIAFSQTQEIINNIVVGNNGYAFLLNPQGIILGIGKNGGEYEVMVDSMVNEANTAQATSWAELVSTMTAGNTGFSEVVDISGKPMFVAYTPVELETGWSLGLAFPQDELFQKASQLQFTLIIYAVFVVIVFSVILYLFTLSITEPLYRLTQYASQFSPEQVLRTKGQPTEPIRIQTRDELEDLTIAFNKMTLDLYQTLETLEVRIQDRTQSLDRRTNQLRAVADVGKSITSYRNLAELLQQTARLINKNFGFYHVGVFILDERRQFAVLTATNSEGGLRMLERSHQLKVGETGIVGYVAETTKARIALDVGEDAVYFNNPDLPNTRSEMALPLVVGGQILGVLDVQSTEPNAFTEEDVSTLQILAEQLAVAIQNANLFAETEKALEASRLAYGEISREAWIKILRNRPSLGYIATPPGISETKTDAVELSIAKAIDTGDLILGNDGLTISVPIKIRGQSIGAIRLKKPEIADTWTQEETNLAVTLSDQLSSALESARLYQDSQQRAARESLVSDISARLSAVTQMDLIIRETVQELGEAIGNASVTFQLLDQSNGHSPIEGDASNQSKGRENGRGKAEA